MAVSVTGQWIDTETGDIVTSQPEEGIQLVAPGREITPAIASRIAATQSAGTGGSGPGADLEAEATARIAADEALDARVSALEP